MSCVIVGYNRTYFSHIIVCFFNFPRNTRTDIICSITFADVYRTTILHTLWMCSQTLSERSQRWTCFLLHPNHLSEAMTDLCEGCADASADDPWTQSLIDINIIKESMDDQFVAWWSLPLTCCFLCRATESVAGIMRCYDLSVSLSINVKNVLYGKGSDLEKWREGFFHDVTERLDRRRRKYIDAVAFD